MSFRRQFVLSALFGASVLGFTCGGCQPESSSSVDGAVDRPGPEESFATIVQFARSQIETGVGGMPSGFVTPEQGGRRSQFIIRNDVTSELIPPTGDSKNYRGTITVTSNSTYSYRRIEDDRSEQKSNSDKSDQNSEQRGLLDDPDSAGLGIDVIDSDLISSAPSTENADPPSSTATPVVSRQEDENVRTFEFAYENDRWVLKTEPDAETERAIKNAFERALAMQL